MSAPGSCIDCQLAISDIWLIYSLNKQVTNTNGHVPNKKRLVRSCCHKRAMRHINVLSHMGYEVVNDRLLDKNNIVQTWEGLQKSID